MLNRRIGRFWSFKIKKRKLKLTFLILLCLLGYFLRKNIVWNFKLKTKKKQFVPVIFENTAVSLAAWCCWPLVRPIHIWRKKAAIELLIFVLQLWLHCLSNCISFMSTNIARVNQKCKQILCLRTFLFHGVHHKICSLAAANTSENTVARSNILPEFNESPWKCRLTEDVCNMTKGGSSLQSKSNYAHCTKFT